MVWTFAGRSQRDFKVEDCSKFAKHWPVPPAPNKGNLVAHEWISIVPSLHTRSYIPYKYQRLGLQSVATLTSQSKVEYRWNTGPAVQFVLISGVPCYTYNFKCPVSIRFKLQVCIPIWCSYPAVQLRGLNLCGTLSAGLQNWNCSTLAKNRPVPRAPNKGNLVAHKWISIVPSLHTRSYIPYKYQRLGLQSVATLTSQSKVEYRWNTGPAVQFVLISGVPCYTYNFKCAVSIRLNCRCIFPYDLVSELCNYVVWTFAGRSQRDFKIEDCSKFAKNRPVPRAPNKGNLVAHKWISIVPSLHTRSYFL